MISLDYENQYKGKIVCGCDEVGRGPLAGPVVAAAVIPIAQSNRTKAILRRSASSRMKNTIRGLDAEIPFVRSFDAIGISVDEMLPGINDSKKISAKKREEYSQYIIANYQYAIGEASVEEIEEINILNATKLAIQRAVDKLANRPDIVLVDGNMKFQDDRYISIIKGDQKSYSIACASIVAKVYRDKMMKELALAHPHYGWEQNAGYGTAKHIKAIREHGITRHHRKSFLSSLQSKDT